MYKSFQWLPIFCLQILSGRCGRNGLHQTLVQCAHELDYMAISRRNEFKYWRGMRLARRELQELDLLQEWSDGELQDLQKAIEHLQAYRLTGERVEVGRAKSRLQMADQANRQYLRVRLKVEPMIHSRRLAMAA